MVAAAQKVLNAFEALPQPAKQEVLDEILRRAAMEHHSGPADDELVAAADDLFVRLDREEERRPRE